MIGIEMNVGEDQSTYNPIHDYTAPTVVAMITVLTLPNLVPSLGTRLTHDSF